MGSRALTAWEGRDICPDKCSATFNVLLQDQAESRILISSPNVKIS